MKFEGDLTRLMVTRDFFGTATKTLLAFTRQENGCDVDGVADTCIVIFLHVHMLFFKCTHFHTPELLL